MNFLSRLRERAQASLAVRLALLMGALASAAAIFLAALSFLVSQRLIAANARIAFDFQTEVVARQIESEVRALDRMLKAMAANAFISNGLVDSLGRDQYLIPYLRDQTVPGAWDGELWLVDFEGKPIAANAPDLHFDHQDSGALGAALAGGHAQVELAHQEQLLYVVPVVFPPTGSIEGAVVAVLKYEPLLTDAGSLIGQEGCLMLRMGEREIPIPAGCRSGTDSPMPSRRLDLPESFRPLHAELQLYTDSATVSVATRYLIAGYLLVGGAVVLLVLLVSKRVSGRIVEPLASLSETADSIVSLQRLDLRAPEVGADEPARLAKSFNKMLESLQLAQAHLIDDIARREQIEEALRRSNRQLRMISDCNQVLIRSSDESELVNTVCRIIVEIGGYHMAHVVYPEGDKAPTLRPVVAHSSRKEGLLDEWNIDSADSERAGGADDTAIRSGQPCVIQDIGSDPRFAPGSVAVGERGYVAVCALPLLAQSRTLGALSIYSVTADAFDRDEVVLLSELAGDLAFGIAVLRVQVERDQADKALRESEFFLRRSQEVGDLGSYYFDARTGTWISSEKLDQIFGIDDSFPKTIAGWTDLVHPEDRKEMLEHLGDHVLAKGNRFDRQYRILRYSDGQERWVHGLGELEFDEHGAAIKMIGTIQDISASRRAEEELQRHREHLEELVAERTAELRQAMAKLVQAEKLAALGHLVAGVAHELNTPLGNTRVVASLLAEQLHEFAAAFSTGTLRRSQMDEFLSRGREAVDLLERNSARAADLIGHFKQVAVDQSSARRRSFDLHQIIEEMLVTLRLTFKHTQHRIEVDIPDGLAMDSYPGPLEQVIANLVANSLTHGFVGIDQGRIELHAQALGEKQVLFRYLDNGVGITTDILNRIFEPFFTTRLGQGGSGLGLYIVYNLVTGVLGGTIEVASSPGCGASFTLTLPLTAPERTTPA